MFYHINSCEKDFPRTDSFQNSYLLFLLIFHLMQHIILMIRIILANMLDVKVLHIFREFILITEYLNYLQDSYFFEFRLLEFGWFKCYTFFF